jgi:hypothetical protein
VAAPAIPPSPYGIDQTARARNVSVRPIVLPVAMGWNVSKWPISGFIYLASIGKSFAEITLNTADLAQFAGWQSYPVYYVRADGNNASDGLTEATAFKSLYRPIVVALAAGQASIRMRVKGGTGALFDRNNTFNLSTVVDTPGLNVVAEAYGGRAKPTTYQSVTWVADATNTLTYTATMNAQRVFDVLARDANGFYVELTKVATAALCNVTPNSWALVGGITYIRRLDGAAVTNTNTRAYVAVDNLYLRGTTQYNMWLKGETAADGFDFEGGGVACFRALYTGGAAGADTVIAAENCTFRYSGASGTGSVGGVAIEGAKGLVLFKNADASAGVTDCWNFHNVLGAASTPVFRTAVVLVNCTGNDAGKTYTYVSCNGPTAHDNVDLLVLGGSFLGNRGVTAHIIDNSKMFICGARIGNSLGDVVNGGSNGPTEIKAEDNAEIWLDTVQCEPGLAGGYGLLVAGNGKIHTKNFVQPCPSIVQGAGIIDTYTA